MLRSAIGALLLVATLVLGVAGPTAAQERQPANSGRIADAEDAAEAALHISQVTFQTGAAEHVVIARSDVFGDSLAGTALAGMAGPILYSPPGPDGRLSEEMLAEVARVLGSPGSCTVPRVWLLGGPAAVAPEVAQQLEESGYCVRRLGGATRVETSLAVAEVVRSRGGSDRVLLAAAENWPDAATAGTYAALHGTPVLLTPGAVLSDPVRSYLAAADPGEIVLLGGPQALAETVEAAAAGFAPTRRIAGADRAGTATQVIDELFAGEEVEGITLVDGYGPQAWVHAIAVAPTAARGRAPLVYARDGGLPAETASWLAQAEYSFVVAAGTERAVSDDALNQAARRTGPGDVPSLPADGGPSWMPPGGGWPDASSTGVPPGVALRPSSKLTVTRDGTVIDGLDVRGNINVRANNVTIRNTRVRASSPYLIRVLPGYGGTVIEDVELDGLGNSRTTGIAGSRVTVRRADIARVGDGVKLGSDSLYERNYIHHLAHVGGAHADGMQAEGAARVTIRGNTIDVPVTSSTSANSAIFLKADSGPVTDIRVHGNAFNGGNFTLFGEGAGPNSNALHSAARITISENVFGRDYRYGLQRVTNVPTWRWVGNHHVDGSAA